MLSRPVCHFFALLLSLIAAGLPASAGAAAHMPTSDAEVLATVPARATDPRARELVALRDAWRARPNDVALAVQLANRYFDQVAAEGDPRYVGYAQAALAPWWELANPPVAVRVTRAMLLQFSHRFPEALADLDASVREQPGNGTAWAWRTAILLVQARYPEARQSCDKLAALADALIGAGCRAQVDAVTGHAAEAAGSLRAALAEATEAGPDERLWALTRLAETEERRGAYAQAEAAFRAALALGEADVYLMAAYADFLLDRGRAAEVLVLLKNSERADVLLLRLALAGKTLGNVDAARWRSELAARFDAAKRRGDTTHQKEESRFVLALQAAPARALALAQQNFAVQREPADARILLEAALGAGQPAAAQPVLDWMTSSGIESAALQGLVTRLKAAR